MRLKLKYPITYLGPVSISQGFGEVSPTYTSMGLKGHNGIDFRAAHGQPVYAAHDGMASFQIDSGGGCGVVLITEQEFDYEGSTTLFKTIYWHLCNSHTEPKYASPFEDKTGFTHVKTGDLIGYADNTGLSTGDHLHFALKPVAKGEAWGTYYNTDPSNGYGGCIDPLPYLIISDQVEELIIEKQTLLKRALALAYQLLSALRAKQNG